MDVDDDDLEIVGESGFNAARDAPHARGDCLVHKMSAGSHAKTCPFCYCWVCDEPASSCTHWKSGCATADCCDPSHRCESHCHATKDQARWVTARAKAKRDEQSRQAAAQRAAAAPRRQPGARRGTAAAGTAAAPAAAASAAAASAAAANAAAPQAAASAGTAPASPAAAGSSGATAAAPPAAAAAAAAAATESERAMAGANEEAEDLFQDYRPRHWTLGCDHPDPVVETTSLAFIAPPALVNQDARLPGIRAVAVANGSLSKLQLEAVAYACVRHEQTLGGSDGP